MSPSELVEEKTTMRPLVVAVSDAQRRRLGKEVEPGVLRVNFCVCQGFGSELLQRRLIQHALLEITVLIKATFKEMATVSKADFEALQEEYQSFKGRTRRSARDQPPDRIGPGEQAAQTRRKGAGARRTAHRQRRTAFRREVALSKQGSRTISSAWIWTGSRGRSRR